MQNSCISLKFLMFLQGVCEQIKPSPMAGCSDLKAQDQGDGSYSNTTKVESNIKQKFALNSIKIPPRPSHPLHNMAEFYVHFHWRIQNLVKEGENSLT